MFRTLAIMSALSIIGALSTFFYQTVGTHIMDVYNYGVFSRWLTDISYLSLFFILGLDTSLLYHARLGEKIESNNIKNIIIYTCLYIVSLIIIFVFSLEPYYSVTLVTTIYLLSLLGIIQAYFQFEEKFTIFYLISVGRPILIFAVFLLVLFKEGILLYKTVIVIYTVATSVLTTIMILVYLLNTKIVRARNFLDYRYYTYGFKSILNKLLALLLYSSSIYIINYLGGYEGVAFFFVASSISKMIWVVPDAAGNLLYPKFLKAKTEKENSSVVNNMYFYGQVVLMFSILSIICFALLGKFFLTFFYQENYSRSFLPTIILLIGNQGMVLYKLLSRYFASRNYWKPLYISLGVSILGSIGLNFLLIPICGIIGSAISVAFAFWVCGITIALFLKGSLIEFLNPIPVVRFSYLKFKTEVLKKYNQK